MIRTALVAGHLCLDMTPQFATSSLPEPGALTIVGPVTLATGGAVSNTGQSLIKMGIPTQLCARIGSDYFGRGVIDVLERNAPGSTRTLAVVPGDVTSYTVVLSPVGKDRAFVHCPGANDNFTSADLPPHDVLAKIDLTHIGYPPVMRRMYVDGGRELVKLLSICKSTGATTSLDLCMIDPNGENGRVDWQQILADVLPYVDAFVPSLDELLLMWDPPAYASRRDGTSKGVPISYFQTMAGWALALGARIVLLKAGTQGIYVRTASADRMIKVGRAAPPDTANWAGRELWAAPFEPDQLVTTTGAGDAAVAGFLAGLLRGATIEESLVMACAAGCCCVEAADTTSGVRTWDETRARIATGWKQMPVQPGAGWTLDADRRVWCGPDDWRCIE